MNMIRHDHSDMQPIRDLMIMHTTIEGDRFLRGFKHASMERREGDEIGLIAFLKMREMAPGCESILSDSHPVSLEHPVYPLRRVDFAEDRQDCLSSTLPLGGVRRLLLVVRHAVRNFS